jgi:hypothetical protein
LLNDLRTDYPEVRDGVEEFCKSEERNRSRLSGHLQEIQM